MDIVYEMKEKVMAGGSITKEEVLILAEEKTGRLAEAADEIRQSFCGNIFDMCTIVNAKSGRCGEDCKFCAQSVRSGCGDVEVYGLMSAQELVKDSEEAGRKGVLRYSMVTSGKRLSVKETDSACEAIKAVVRNLKEKDMDMEICVSFGLLGEEEFKRVSALAQYAREEINKIGGYYAFGEELINGDSIYDFDKTKLSVHTLEIGLAGIEVYDILRSGKYPGLSVYWRQKTGSGTSGERPGRSQEKISEGQSRYALTGVRFPECHHDAAGIFLCAKRISSSGRHAWKSLQRVCDVLSSWNTGSGSWRKDNKRCSGLYYLCKRKGMFHDRTGRSGH